MNKLAFREIQKKLKLTNEGVSEAMDVELFAVQQWASGVWPVPKAMAKFLRTLLSAKRDMTDVYMSAHHRGWQAGRKEGIETEQLNHREGYAKGYENAFLDGLKKGRKEGRKEGRASYKDGYLDAMRDAGITR